jgi:hypothetical protein
MVMIDEERALGEEVSDERCRAEGVDVVSDGYLSPI